MSTSTSLTPTLSRPAEQAAAARAKPDWIAHVVLCLGVLLFALPVWLVLAGSTQDSGRDHPRRTVAAAESRPVRLSARPDARHAWAPNRYGTCCWSPVAWRWRSPCGKIVISILSAYAVVFFRFPFRRVAFWLIFITLMLPVEVRIIPTYAVMAGFGLINSFTGLTRAADRLGHRDAVVPAGVRRDPR